MKKMEQRIQLTRGLVYYVGTYFSSSFDDHRPVPSAVINIQYLTPIYVSSRNCNSQVIAKSESIPRIEVILGRA